MEGKCTAASGRTFLVAVGSGFNSSSRGYLAVIVEANARSLLGGIATKVEDIVVVDVTVCVVVVVDVRLHDILKCDLSSWLC